MPEVFKPVNSWQQVSFIGTVKDSDYIDLYKYGS